MPLVVVKKRPRSPADPGLIIVIGKRVAKRAVVRNKIKRRIRAIIRPHLASRAYTVIVRPESASASFEILKKDIESQL